MKTQKLCKLALMVRLYKSHADKKRYVKPHQSRLKRRSNNFVETRKKDQKEPNGSGNWNLNHEKRRERQYLQQYY